VKNEGGGVATAVAFASQHDDLFHHHVTLRP